MTVVDHDLETRAVWVPLDGRVPSIAYASERRRRRLALLGPAGALLVALLCWAAGVPASVAGLALGVPLLLGAWLTLTGRSGYYELGRDGRPCSYLGRRQPDLSAHVRAARSARA